MKLRNITISLLLALGLSLNAQNKEEVVSQCVGTVTLDKPIDYVITGGDPFATNATIDIANPDASVVFKNIRPSDVISKYLRYVNVNGVELKNNVNCRVSIYRHGAIVLPHSDTKNPDGTTFHPLTTFSGDGFTGDSLQYNNTGRNTKENGSFSIRSFKIKRGYMVTMANNTDGTGYSHCFIANKGDKVVDLAKLEKGKFLADKVGFFRIFRWQWPGKLGMSDARDDKLINQTNASWFYDWGAGNSLRDNAEYVPQRHHESGQSNNNGYKGAWESFGNINNLNNTNTHILGQNEPDNTGGGNEVYTYVTKIPDNPREKHGDYPLVNVAKDFLYSGMRIGTFACCNPNTGWVTEYVNWCRKHNVRIDFVATHYYIGGTDPAGCVSRLKALYDATGLPVWATEWNNGANWTTEGGFNTDGGWYSWGSGNDQKKNGEWLRDVLKRADKEKWLERLAVYNAVEGKREIWTNGAPTEAAKVLSTYQSGFAYDDDNEYWMPWTYLAPESLEINYTKAKNRVELTWTHNNSKQTDYACIEIKVADEDNKWTELANLGVLNKMAQKVNYTTIPELELQGKTGAIYFRIADHDNDGKVRYSNEVSVTIGSARGTDKYQYGKIAVTNTNAIETTFSESFSTMPAIFMGVISNKNSTLYPGNLISSATKTKFSYQVLPGKSQGTSAKTTVDNAEEIPFLALKDTTNFDFGGIKAETGNAKVNMVDTTYVTFREAFPEGVTPIILTELRNSLLKNYPISIRIKDVSNKGFKAISMYEEGAGTPSKANQTMCYLAIQPGVGILDKDSELMIAAGLGDGVYGTTYRAITFNDGNGTLYFDNPLIYGALQTLNHHSAVVLRRTNDIVDSDNGLTSGTRIKRQIDASSKTTDKNTAAFADTFGWVIIANINEGGSTPTSINNVINNGANAFMVQVSNGTIHINGKSNCEVYSLSGIRLRNANLAPGSYIVKNGDKKIKVFVK